MTDLGKAVRVYAGLLLVAVMCLSSSGGILVCGIFVPRSRRPRFARARLSRMFRRYLALMVRVGSLRLDISALDSLRDAPAMVIAPNHPSMIDAALLISRLADLTCIMKTEILHNPLFGSGARSAGYITSEPARAMLRAAVDSLHGGSHLLLFPEGTRTRGLPVNPLQGTVGMIARRARVPVQAVIIETNSAFLAKGWPLLRMPLMPMVYTVRLGRRFDPPDDVDAFTQDLQAYFHEELASARLPPLPLTERSR